MALSASIDFSLTARQVITLALEELRVIAGGEEPGATDAEFARKKLNVMLKGWQRHENLWRLTEGSITLVADDYDYTLSPVPHRVIAARYRDANSRDLPMTLMSREEYYDLPLKTTTGIPTQYYVDYQRSAATFLLWQALDTVTTETIKYTYYKKFDDIDTLDDDIEVRSEHLGVVADNLAVQLGTSFGKASSPNFMELKERAFLGLQTALDEDREDEIRFVPAGRYG